MKKISMVLLGAGIRGMAYSAYALSHPHEGQFVAIAEPDNERRKLFQRLHNLPENACYKSWEELMAEPKLADAILICTQDRMHFNSTVKAIEKGYHVLLEKPMSNDPQECYVMEEYAKKFEKILSICYVLRYTEFFVAIKKLLVEGKIGKLVSIQHNENVAHWHQAHSFVRGNWRNSAESSPMILAKCCHDMDILHWLAGGECINISSFGYLTHFKSENAPSGAPKRCLDGCPVENECPYYAPKTYLTDNIDWPTSVISNDTSIEARTKALLEGPYGRCVYHCDNDVVDHQVVNMEFENDITAVFTMCAFTLDETRTIKLMGTKGEIRGCMEKDEIEILNFLNGSKEVIHLKATKGIHGGGDSVIMYDFIKCVQNAGLGKELSCSETSVHSHMMAFAAEKSRNEKKTINIREFIKDLKA